MWSLLTAALLAQAPAVKAADAPAPARAAQPAVGAAAFAHLRFLQGRWTGTGPDGVAFYEEYDFPSPTSLRSRRFPDAQFREATDGSTVTVENGAVVSRWGKFSWRASRLELGLAEFEPVEAPSAFSWRRIDGDHVEVVQRWSDEKGQPQRYALVLTRVR